MEKPDHEAAVDSIADHCNDMTATVERTETVVDVLWWVTDTSESSVDVAIERAIPTVEDEWHNAPIEVTGDTGTTVLADELLSLAVCLTTAGESRPSREGRAFRPQVGTEDRTGRE